MSIAPDLGALHLKRALASAGASLGLRGEVDVAWIYNPGNFSNASYRVSDGALGLHVKVVEDPRRADVWYRLRHRMAQEYRAPDILARIELGDTGLTAYVYPRLPGRPLDPLLDGAVLREVAALLRRLHGDKDLAADLADGGIQTLRSSYEAGLLACLSEDLRAVRDHPDVCRCLDRSTLEWLTAEVEALEAEGRRQIPDEPAGSPIHGDPWVANVLVHAGSWYLLDWDEMRLGDPAGDWAMFLFEAWVRDVSVHELLPPDAKLRQRFLLHLRAVAFDAIVDPLSDLTEMRAGISEAERIRKEKRRRSEIALSRYRALYERFRP